MLKPPSILFALSKVHGWFIAPNGKGCLSGRSHCCRCVEINFSEVWGISGVFKGEFGEKTKGAHVRGSLRHPIWSILERTWGTYDRGPQVSEKLNYVKLDKTSPNVVVSLMGRFKGEEGERIFLAFVNRTGTSDLIIIWWVEILSAVLVREGNAKEVGPYFCDEDGYVLS